MWQLAVRVVTGGGMANNKMVIGANLFKITVDVNSITISTTYRVIVDIETTSEHKYPKGAMCQFVTVYELMGWIVQHTLVNSSSYIE
jgi:hypothetical protein